MSERRARVDGIGDRWLAGERLPGVEHAQGARVRVTSGRHAGEAGRVALLAAPPDPEAAYIVHLDDGRMVRVAAHALAASA